MSNNEKMSVQGRVIWGAAGLLGLGIVLGCAFPDQAHDVVDTLTELGREAWRALVDTIPHVLITEFHNHSVPSTPVYPGINTPAGNL